MTVCGLITGFHPIGKLGNIQVVAKKLPCQSGQPLESQQLASGFRNRKSVGRVYAITRTNPNSVMAHVATTIGVLAKIESVART